jgi:two-component system cell cycle response regulator DivK
MRNARILVVEDNELNLKLVRDVLTHAGFDVVEARTGEDGVELAMHCAPDLVLMDLQLPGIDGA